MKGTNTLKLNHATAIEAFQQWVNSTFAAKGLKVTDVRQTSSSMSNEFEVTVAANDQPLFQPER